jgi:hypothetical protein
LPESPLKREAERIIEELDLLRLLSAYGEARIVGSVALDLIVKLDIDIHLLVDNLDVLEVVNGISNSLLTYGNVPEVRITKIPGHGIKVGVDKYPSGSGDWSIDILVTNDPSSTAFDSAERLRASLTPEQRKVILALKRHYYAEGRLRDGMSHRIYTAVIERGVRTIDEFEGQPT